MNPLRLGTRGSPLALWQANHVAALLRAVVPDRPIELVEISTTGDQVRDRPLAAIGGDGLFTKEIQNALLDGRADVAVHSLKDLPTTFVAGLILAAVPMRGPNGDVMVSLRWRRFDELPQGAVVASGSLRRCAQLRHRRPDLKLNGLRGNVETRLNKLAGEGFDAIILAHAGLQRLGRSNAITEILDPQWMLPAVGQGAIGLECRDTDETTHQLLSQINHEQTFFAVRAERAMLRALGGGCQVPIGAATHVDGPTLTLRGIVIAPDGSERIEAQGTGPLPQAEALGEQLAQQLLAKGARQLL